MKLRMSLVLLADQYDQRIRELIYRTYTDPHLASLYRAIRTSGIYEKGGESKVHRKIVEIPNVYVDGFLQAVFGRDYYKDDRALRHELIRPWWVVAKL